jgi:hypothetical protein
VTISITPKSALSSTPPAVGIFWLVADSIVIDRSTLGEGEPYGDCITHAAGHYERWLEWQASGAASMAARGYPGQIIST